MNKLTIFLLAFLIIGLIFLIIPPNNKEEMIDRPTGGWVSHQINKNIEDDIPLFYIDGKYIKIEDLPSYLIDSLVAAEDARFYQHPGVDPVGIARALWVDLKCFCLDQGGSTLTQQLARNVFLTPDKNIIRKGKEALISLKIESLYSKEEILEFYLNYVYYGDEIYYNTKFRKPMFGIEQISNFYFNKSASNLTLGESTIIIATLRSPGYYNPYLHYDRARERQEIILNLMVDYGYITWEQYQEALNEEIIFIQHPQDDKSIIEKYYSKGSYPIIKHLI